MITIRTRQTPPPKRWPMWQALLAAWVVITFGLLAIVALFYAATGGP